MIREVLRDVLVVLVLVLVLAPVVTASSSTSRTEVFVAPPYAISCSFNPILIEVSCVDSTNYLGLGVSSTSWFYDGAAVQSTPPDSSITFRPYNQSWTSTPANHTVSIVAAGSAGEYSTGSVTIREDETVAWLLILAIFGFVVVGSVWITSSDGDGSVYFMPIPSDYRRTAIRVEEHPRGWMSYTQTDDSEFSRFRSSRPNRNRWVVYGIRPATDRERERIHRRYVGEVQTVRERIET